MQCVIGASYPLQFPRISLGDGMRMHYLVITRCRGGAVYWPIQERCDLDMLYEFVDFIQVCTPNPTTIRSVFCVALLFQTQRRGLLYQYCTHTWPAQWGCKFRKMLGLRMVKAYYCELRLLLQE